VEALRNELRLALERSDSERDFACQGALIVARGPVAP
jgi:hypothetical protein